LDRPNKLDKSELVGGNRVYEQTKWSFITVAVCDSGELKGKILATVAYSFELTRDGQIVLLDKAKFSPRRVLEDWKKAIDEWNKGRSEKLGPFMQ
jgi:hypothetical protein